MAKPLPSGPFIRGVNAAAQVLAQPKGSIPRCSNFFLTARGALSVCDGTQILNWYNGAIQTNRGNFEAIALFQPINTLRYFLALVKALDQMLVAPSSLAAANGGAGGTLAAGTYFYVVTALDGAGGETTASNEVSITIGANVKVSLTWTAVTNATGYNVYRGATSGSEVLVAQSTTNSFTDSGSVPMPQVFTLVSSSVTSEVLVPPISKNFWVFTATTTLPLTITQFTITGVTPTLFNQTYISGISVNGNTALAQSSGQGFNTTGTGGTLTIQTTPPTVNTTQQVALYKMPNLGLAPLTYTNANIVALFPADARPYIPSGPGGSGGGGGTGSGGGSGAVGGGPPTASGGVANNTSPIPQMVQFQNQMVLALGNGFPPQIFTDPSTIAAVTSTFVPAYPTWSATTAYSLGSIVQPSPANNHFYKAIQPGTSGGSQPTFPTAKGAQVADGSVVWQEAGLSNTGAPAPPGAAHCIVYAGSLWVGNTWIADTTNGLDGPSAIRMSDVNNPNSWNPVNQAFLDKDDGTQIQGFSAFTITAQGIPPVGSLVVFKDFSTFQVQGVFGSANFAIQRTKSDMGCIAPRSIQFVPGFGVTRLTHLGIAVFDGVEDRVISEEIRPYLFPLNDVAVSDIQVLDANFAYSSFGFQTADPPTYCLLIPIGNSTGMLTRILVYDLVLRAWTVVDLPFALSTATQVRAAGTAPISVFGGFNDGVLQRWQAGDSQWYGGGPSPSQVQWSFRTAEVFNQASDQRLYVRNHVIRGINTSSTSPITVTPTINGQQFTPISRNMVATGQDFDIFVPIGATAVRFSATTTGSGDVEIIGVTWHVDEKPIMVPLSVG